jgi:hypothetical protein
MANITLSGTLLDSIGEVDVGAIVTFTHLTTTGQTIKGTSNNLIVAPNGAYTINLEYGQIRIDYTTKFTERFVAMVVVNSDSTATNLPDLLNASVPPTDAQLLQFQAILADTVVAKNAAEAALAGIPTYGTAATKNTGTGAGELPTTAEADARYLLESNNLSDLDSAIFARTNLGLGTAATADVTTSTTDTTTGRLIKQGDTVSLSDILTSGFFTARSSSRSTTARSGNGGGAGIFPTLGAGPIQGILYAINITTGAYLVATVRKLNAANSPVATILNNASLTVSATNSAGTIVLSDTSANVKMFATINIME